MTADPPFDDPNVRARFESFPEPERGHLLALRRLIFECAAATPGVGPLEETLKWGQPAYLTPVTRSGSTIRLGIPKQGGYAVFTHCQTSLIDDFRERFPDDFRFDGNRAVEFQADESPALDKLGILVREALTYRLSKKGR